jgi:hypothetical protein
MKLAYSSTLLLLLFLSGCSRGYFFDLRCVILDAVTKQPVQDVKIVLNTWGFKDRPDLDRSLSKTTNHLGETDETFFVSSSDFDNGLPRWFIKISKPGYKDEILDISPRCRTPSATHDSPAPIFVFINLAPASK